METILPIQTSAPIQNHPETKPLFNELMYAVKKLSEASKGGEVFREILTGIEKLSAEDKIVQLENAFSKYDELSLELRKPILLNGHLELDTQQLVIIEKNINSIKNSIKAEIDLISKAKNYVTRSSDLLFTSEFDSRHKLTTEQKQEKLVNLKLFSSTASTNSSVGRSSQLANEEAFVSVAANADTLSIAGKQFVIENTSGMEHNCLAYALQKDNASLDRNYRRTTFSSENIKAQLVKTQSYYSQNQLRSNDGMSDFDVLLEAVRTNYDMTINASIKNIDSLSKALANHIQQTDCMLDGPIAGGIFASTSKQPVIFVKQDPYGELAFNVLDQEGRLIHQGDSLDTVPASLLNNAKYVHNSNGLHFERMVRV